MITFKQFFYESLVLPTDNKRDVYYVYGNRQGFIGPLEDALTHYDPDLINAYDSPPAERYGDLAPLCNKKTTLNDIKEVLWLYFDVDDNQFHKVFKNIRKNFTPFFEPHELPSYWRVILDMNNCVYIIAEVDTIKFKQSRISKSLHTLKNNTSVNALFKKN